MEPFEHEGLARSMAIRYHRSCYGAVEMDDLMQCARLGVLRAKESYDPNIARFSTYAAHWIRFFIEREIANKCRTIRIPVHLQVKSRKAGGKPVPVTCYSVDNPQSPDDAAIGWSHSPDDALPQDEQLHLHRMARAVMQALDSLPEREALIIRERWFAESEPTLGELGDKLGITRERVRQLQAKALERLRPLLEGVEQ